MHPGISLSYIDCEYTSIYRVVLEDLQLDNQVNATNVTFACEG